MRHMPNVLGVMLHFCEYCFKCLERGRSYRSRSKRLEWGGHVLDLTVTRQGGANKILKGIGPAHPRVTTPPLYPPPTPPIPVF